MKLALINPPYRQVLDFTKPSFPLGLGYLKVMCKLNGISCDLYDLSHTVLTDNELCLKYKFSEYDCIGFSTYTVNFKDTIKLIKKIKTNKNIILIGGHHASLLGEKILDDFEFIDYTIMGYAENSFVNFIKFQNTSTLYDIPGLCYRKNDVIYKNEAVYCELDLDKIPYPDFDDIIYDYPENLEDLMELHISSSRGCLFRCTFCVNCRRSFWIPRTVSDVVAEIAHQFDKKHYKVVNFIDCNFFINPERAVEIIEKTNDMFPGVRIIFQTRSDQIVRHETVIKRLLNNFNIRIIMGIESNSIDVLNRYKKDTTPEINQKAISILKEHYSEVIIYLIMFDPLTTIKEVRTTFDFLKENDLFNFQNSRNLFQTMIPLYGTDYFDEYKNHYKIDIHSISKPIYVNNDVQTLKNCYDLFINDYDDRIKAKLYYILLTESELDDGDFKFFEIIYYYVFEFFLISLEKFGHTSYDFFKTTSIFNKLVNMLLKYENKRDCEE